MADVAALYGLFGAVGGALLGAGATVAAPMLLNRHSRREQQLSRTEAQFQRLMVLRQCTREAELILTDAYLAVLRGAPVDIRELLADMNAAERAVRDAADALAIDGLDFAHTISSRDALRGVRSSPENDCLLRLTRAMGNLKKALLRASSPAQGRVGRETRDDLRRLADAVGQRRRVLLGMIFDRMEGLRTTVTPPERPTRRGVAPRARS